MQMSNIVLIGFMGSGKTSVAQSLSKLFKLPWVEMDHLVYQKTNTQNMHEVFAKGGELLLRETEIAIVKEYAPKKGLVFSTGGGVVLNKIILDYFKAAGARVIFLDTSFETITMRLAGDASRPLFQNVLQAKQMYDFRIPLYRQYADVVVDANRGTPDEIAAKISLYPFRLNGTQEA